MLLDTIGTFPEENKAYEQIKLMPILSYTILVILTMVQVVSYYFFNGKFHPYAMIVMSERIFPQKVNGWTEDQGVKLTKIEKRNLT